MKTHTAPEVDVNQLVADNDTGGREPGPWMRRMLLAVALAWSLFQLWIASPLPYLVSNLMPVLNDTQTRAIHLAFAVFLAYMAYPASKRSPRDRVPVLDWVFAIAGAYAAAYIFIFYRELATRPGMPLPVDVWTAVVGVVLLLEATRRVLGLPMVIVALVFLGYTFAGPYMPDLIAHKGASLDRAMTHQWLTTEGVYGVALGVSSGFIFLFVLFGNFFVMMGGGQLFFDKAPPLAGKGDHEKTQAVAGGRIGKRHGRILMLLQLICNSN